MKPSSYAGRWPMLVFTAVLFTGATFNAAPDGDPIVLATAHILALALMFAAGFCYRERLRQLDREPRWRFFRRMLDKSAD